MRRSTIGCVALILLAGNVWAEDKTRPIAESVLQEAARKPLALIQHSQKIWNRRASCTSCHHQILPELVQAAARERGVPFDATFARATALDSFSYLKDLDAIVQGHNFIDEVDEAWKLLAADAAGVPASLSTSASAQLLASLQRPDGSWYTIDSRPPQSHSRFTATAIAAQSVQLYFPASLKPQKEATLRRAREWLLKTPPRTTEDRTFQLLGLLWTDAPEDVRKKIAEPLLAAQSRDDGGWSQLPRLGSDAYATGEVLYALHLAAGLATDSPAYQRGLHYLLKTQAEDGSWRVLSRIDSSVNASPPLFNSGFPHEKHQQFISIMGTAWATLAVLQAIPPRADALPKAPLQGLEPAEKADWIAVLLNGSAADLKRALVNKDMQPDSQTAHGTTALMLAARDPEKVKLLLEHKADVTARAKAGIDALTVAARYRGNAAAVRLLLVHGAKPNAEKGVEVKNSAIPLFFAAYTGDLEMARALLDAGAVVDGETLVLGEIRMIPLTAATRRGDTAMVDYLLRRDANLHWTSRSKLTPLHLAVLSNHAETVKLLLAKHPNLELVDDQGLTPLHYAVSLDYGDTTVVEQLLAAGADRTAKDKRGRTALDLAKEYKHTSIEAVLARLEPAWYSPHELLPALAQRDGIRWALPETLSGRAWIGGDRSCKAALNEACKQWKLTWTEANGVIVVHRADDAKLQTLTAALKKGDKDAAWELGWLRDGRAVPVLAEALAGKDAGVALAAAQALQTLLTDIPLGREERVEAPLRGRVSLAVAFPPTVELLPLGESPYPPVRAAALRVLLGLGKADKFALPPFTHEVAERQVRQQLDFTPRKEKPRQLRPIPPAPKDPDELKAACAKIVAELPGLEKQSGWEEMTWRAEVLSAWARAGHEAAGDALFELTTTKLQQFWYPGIVQKCLAQSGSEKALARIKEMMPRAARPFLVRGLEESVYGADLVALTGPYLAEEAVCYVTARKAGREALDLLLPLAEKGNLAAIDALGVIGGPQAVAVLKQTLMREEAHSATLAFRSAKALGQIGTVDVLDVLLAAAADKNVLRRHAAVLFLGRIGGPKAEALLNDALKDSARLVRAAAADGLEQIGTKEALAAASTFRNADSGSPSLVHSPRNARFGPDFPVNEWVNLKIAVLAQGWGEIGWNHDPANHLFFRYGGCTGPYNNELTVFDLGTEQFVQRRPIDLMAGWGDARPGNGCSVGRTWDPVLKVAWIRHGIGGTGNQLGMVDYHSRSPAARFASYDLATDRFHAAAYHEAPYGESATRLVCDWKHGLVMPIKFTHPNHKTKDFWALDTTAPDPYAEAAWSNRTNPGGDYPRQPHAAYTTAAVDRDAGLLVVYIPPFETRPPETWTYDAEKNLWKNMQPKVQPQGVHGAGLAYDPYHKVVLLQSGRKATQFGGPNDSLTWTYDVRTNTWTDLEAKNGPGNPWVGAMDFDPEHNVFVLFSFKDKQVWAYRHKAVADGTRVK